MHDKGIDDIVCSQVLPSLGGSGGGDSKSAVSSYSGMVEVYFTIP